VNDFTPAKRHNAANRCPNRWKSGSGSVYSSPQPITRDRLMSWLDIYLVVLFLALVGLLVVKFRG
jgi:hypothetical protein